MNHLSELRACNRTYQSQRNICIHTHARACCLWHCTRTPWHTCTQHQDIALPEDHAVKTVRAHDVDMKIFFCFCGTMTSCIIVCASEGHYVHTCRAKGSLISGWHFPVLVFA